MVLRKTKTWMQMGATDGDDMVPLVDYDEKHIHAGQHLQPPDEPQSPPAVANLLDLKDWEGVSVEDMKLFTRSVRQQILSEKLKSYKWSPALLESVLYFPDLQEPSPMIHEDRQKLTQETPDLSTAAPCENLEGFGDLKFHLAEKDFWFLAKAVPRIHQNIYQEISTLAFILQEATPVTGVDDGSRIGLDEQGILALLKRVIRLKIDTLSLLADYQIDRSRKALRRPPRKPRTEQKKKPIISEKMQAEDEKKLEKERKQAKSWGFASARNRGLSGKGDHGGLASPPSSPTTPRDSSHLSTEIQGRYHRHSKLVSRETGRETTGGRTTKEDSTSTTTTTRRVSPGHSRARSSSRSPEARCKGFNRAKPQSALGVPGAPHGVGKGHAPHRDAASGGTPVPLRAKLGQQFPPEKAQGGMVVQVEGHSSGHGQGRDPPGVGGRPGYPSAAQRGTPAERSSGAIPSQSQGCIFKIFLVDKRETKEKRPVVNMRALSPFVHSPHFKMEGLTIARDLIQEGDWFSRVDLKDAYLHVPLHPNIRPWFRYRVLGEVFQWRTIPFGFKDSPRMFQKLIVEGLTPLRSQGLRLVIYLDDILLISPSYSQCLQEANLLVQLLLKLGFVVNLKKSELTPTQEKTFLGVAMDSRAMSFSLPPAKVKAFRKRIASMLGKATGGAHSQGVAVHRRDTGLHGGLHPGDQAPLELAHGGAGKGHPGENGESHHLGGGQAGPAVVEGKSGALERQTSSPGQWTSPWTWTPATWGWGQCSWGKGERRCEPTASFRRGTPPTSTTDVGSGARAVGIATKLG